MEISNGRSQVGRVAPQTSASNPITSCAYGVHIAPAQLIVSRASVLTLWASIVAERLGHQRSTALTLGRAVAGPTARLKVRVIGREEWVGDTEEIGPALGLDLPRRHKKRDAQAVLLGKTIRLLPDASGQLRAALRTLPARDGAVADEHVAADPAEIERYLIKTFGPQLAHVRTAMEGLAACYEPMELNRIGFQLHEKFQHCRSYGRGGGRVKAVLEIENILAAMPHATDHDYKSAGLNTPLHRCSPDIAKPTGRQRRTYQTPPVMAEHRQTVASISAAAAKMEATVNRLQSVIAKSRQLIAESGDIMARSTKLPRWQRLE